MENACSTGDKCQGSIDLGRFRGRNVAACIGRRARSGFRFPFLLDLDKIVPGDRTHIQPLIYVHGISLFYSKKVRPGTCPHHILATLLW